MGFDSNEKLLSFFVLLALLLSLLKILIFLLLVEDNVTMSPIDREGTKILLWGTKILVPLGLKINKLIKYYKIL